MYWPPQANVCKRVRAVWLAEASVEEAVSRPKRHVVVWHVPAAESTKKRANVRAVNSAVVNSAAVSSRAVVRCDRSFRGVVLAAACPSRPLQSVLCWNEVERIGSSATG
jgi:hypothetical protein